MPPYDPDAPQDQPAEKRGSSRVFSSLIGSIKTSKNVLGGASSSSSSPTLSPSTPFLHGGPFASIPRRYYRSRTVSLAICLLAFIAVYSLSQAVNWALPENLDSVQLQSGMTMMRGTTNILRFKPARTQEVEEEGESEEVEDETEEAGESLAQEDLPPLYPEYFDYEESLLQHHAPLAPGTKKKFIHFANHVHLLGFNNHLDEYLVHAHLGYLVNRSFVFHEYTWNPAFEQEPYTDWNGRKIPSRVPESVILGGWLGGEARQDTTPPITADDYDWDVTPISRPFYEKTCPPESRMYIRVDDVMSLQMSSLLDIAQYPDLAGKQVKDGNGIQLVHAWVARLAQDDVRDVQCVEIAKDSGHAFDFWLFGSTSLHSLWESLSQSPILQHWSFSPLVYEAFRTNVVESEILGETMKRMVEAEVPARDAHAKHPRGQTVVDGIEYDEHGYPTYPGGYVYPPTYTPPSTTTAVTGQFPFDQRSLKVQPYPRTPAATWVGNGSEVTDGTLPILALHLRRGDFEEHCGNLAEWGSTFVGFVTFDEFARRDGFQVPSQAEVPVAVQEGRAEVQADDVTEGSVQVDISTSGVTSRSSFIGHTFAARDPRTVKNAEERHELYARHCYPHTEQVVKRVKEVVEDWVGGRWIAWVENWEKSKAVGGDDERLYHEALSMWKRETLTKLKGIYIMTNGDRVWAGEVRKALRGLTEGYGAGVGEWDFRFQVDIEIRNELDKSAVKKTRSLQWRVDEWPWDAYYAKAGEENGSSPASHDQVSREERPKVHGAWWLLSWAMSTSPTRKATPIVIATARDLQLRKEEKYVAQAVDMYFGQRAEIFIGNGFSSMTGNVAMLRKKDGLDPLQTRMW